VELPVPVVTRSSQKSRSARTELPLFGWLPEEDEVLFAAGATFTLLANRVAGGVRFL